MSSTVLVDVKGVAEYLNVHEESVRRWVRENKIPYRKVVKRYRFDLEQIRIWSEEEQSKVNNSE